jgi:hypothetical protein
MCISIQNHLGNATDHTRECWRPLYNKPENKSTMKFFSIFILTLSSIFGFGQNIEKAKYLTEIEKQDISDLWTLDRFEYDFEAKANVVKRQEPLGYIGDNYQRFQIHFISVIQNPLNKLEYFVYGKTRVKTNICSFQGSITITESGLYTSNEHPSIKQGIINGAYKFYEDPNQKGGGVLKGNLKTYFFINKAGNIQYDAISFISDEYKNNLFEGTWTSYASGETKKCNWGDYRIPDSRELDCGAGEFGVTDQYAHNGWESYMTATGIKTGNMTVKEARKTEEEKWWQEKN